MGWLARKADESTARAERVVPLRVAPVEVQVMGRDSLDVLRARNVSMTGLGVFVPHGFAGFDLEAEVGLIVTLPRTSSFQARGVIKHVTDVIGETKHFGLHFTEVSKPHRKALERYVKSRLG